MFGLHPCGCTSSRDCWEFCGVIVLVESFAWIAVCLNSLLMFCEQVSDHLYRAFNRRVASNPRQGAEDSMLEATAVCVYKI